jgi:hypothetical protein
MLTNDVFAEVHWSHFFILKFGVLVILFFTNRFTIMMFKNVKWSCFSSISTNKASNHCRQTFGRCDNKTTLFTKQNKYYKRLYYYTIRLQQTNRLFWLWTTNSSLDEDLIDLWWTLNNPAHPCTPEQDATTKWNNGTISRNLLQCFFQTSFIFNPYRRRPAISSNAEHQRRTASAEWKTTTRLVLARFRAHQVALTLLLNSFRILYFEIERGILLLFRAARKPAFLMPVIES